MEMKIYDLGVKKVIFPLKIFKSETLKSEGVKIMAAILNGSVGVWQSHRLQAKKLCKHRIKMKAKTSQKRAK